MTLLYVGAAESYPATMAQARHRRILTAIVSLLVVSTLPTPDASGFDVLRKADGRALRWPDRPIAVFLQARAHDKLSIAQVHKALGRAIGRYNDAAGSLLELVDGGLVDEPPGFDIYVAFAPQTAPSADRSGSVSLDSDAWGRLRRVVILLDNQTVTFSTQSGALGGFVLDLESALVHHLGHAVGLAHSRKPEASMFFFDPGAAGRSLDLDDERGLAWLYPVSPSVSGQACDACDGDGQCATGTCATWPSKDSYCVQGCGGHDDCPIGFSCAGWAGGKACLPNDRHCAPELAAAPVGGHCASDLACPGITSCWTGMDDGVCTQLCVSDAQCSGASRCTEIGAGNATAYICLVAGNGGLGERCSGASDCASRICAPSLAGGGRCSAICEGGAACPQGDCDSGGFCTTKGQLPVGWPCGSGFDCETGQCVEHPGGPFKRACTTPCEIATDCPAGTGCTPAGSGTWCLPFGPPVLGGPCSTPGACGAGALCDSGLVPGFGACRAVCDPFGDGLDCDAGKRCVWVGATSAKAGACRDSGGGKLVGEACAPDDACRVDLLCAGPAGNPSCREVCNPDAADAKGCSAGGWCVLLDTSGLDKPRRGVCSDSADEMTEVPPKPVEASGNFAAKDFTLAGVKPWQAPGEPNVDEREVSSGEGCGARAGGADGLWLVLLALATVWLRRRWSRIGASGDL